MAKLNTEDLDLILNDCLNKAMCRKGRIQHPNSNKIAEFVTNYINSTDLSVGVDEMREQANELLPRVMPSTCPKCGCQVYDPFEGTTIIHDIEKCGGIRF